MIDDAVNLPVNPVFGNPTVPVEYISSAASPMRPTGPSVRAIPTPMEFLPERFALLS